MTLTGKILIAAAAVAAFSGSAMAADLYVPPAAPAAPVAAAPTNWDGPYIGATVGYGWGTISGTPAGGVAGTYNPDGWSLGAQLGYNFHLADQVVLGLQGDVNWFRADSYFTDDNGWNGAVMARLGYDAGTILPYIEAGVAFANIDSSSSTGWAAGAGVEFMLADQVSLNAEYRYVDYGTIAGSTGDFDDNQFRIGLNYHF